MQDFVLATSAILIILGLFIIAGGWASQVQRRLEQGWAALRARLQAGRPALNPRRHAAVAATAPASLPAPISRDAQWDRATGVLTDAIARVEDVKALQKAAEQQIDSATYAIQRLFAELSSVVSLPAPIVVALPAHDEAGATVLAATSSVHQLVAMPQREQAGAAMAA